MCKKVIIIALFLLFVFKSNISAQIDQAVNKSCNTSQLDKRKLATFNNQKEKLAGIWVVWRVNSEQIRLVVQSSNEMGEIIGSKLSKNEKPSIAKYIFSIQEAIKSLETHNQINELRMLENKTYCYYLHCLELCNTIKGYIVNNEPNIALQKIREHFKSVMDESELIYKGVYDETIAISKKYGFDNVPSR